MRSPHFFRSITQRITEKSRHISFPGFNKVPVYDVTVFFVREVQNDRFTIRAAAVAFYLMLALFPGIIFLFTLVPYIPVDGFRDTLLNELQSVMPQTVFAFLHTAIQDIVSVQRIDLLSVGFLSAFFFSTNGVIAIMTAFDKSRNLPQFKRWKFFYKRWVGIKLTFLLSLILLMSVALIIGWNALVGLASEQFTWFNTYTRLALSLVRWILVLALFFLSVATIYYYGPSRINKWKFISTGATLATVLSIITSLLFSWLVNHFNLYNKIYGSIGALLAAMLWFYLNALVLLIGFELNTAIDQKKSLLDMNEE